MMVLIALQKKYVIKILKKEKKREKICGQVDQTVTPWSKLQIYLHQHQDENTYAKNN